MTRYAKRSILLGLVALAVLLPLVFTTTAAAYPGLNSWSETQVGPGQTLRTIYGDTQAYLYQLPTNVTHKGYIHVELKYKGWPDYDCYIWVIDESNNIVAQSGGFNSDMQGWMGTWYAKEVVDFYVDDIYNQTVVPSGDDIEGDIYYVLVQSFADVHPFQISGYYPRIDYSGGPVQVGGNYNWYRDTFRYPKAKDAWQHLHGTPYGGPYDFTPTSEGEAALQVRYPWNPTGSTKPDPNAPPPSTVGPRMPYQNYLDSPAKQEAALSMYLYPWDWSEDGAIWYEAPWVAANRCWTLGVIDDYDASGYVRGIQQKYQVETESNRMPNKAEHFLVCGWMAAASAGGPSDWPKTGLVTVGFKANIKYPQNLFLTKSSVKMVGGKVQLKGNAAYNEIWVNSAGTDAIVWLPDGEKVTIQYRIGRGAWKKAGTGTVAGGAGAWTAKVTYRKGAKYRAFWQGTQMKSTTVKARTVDVVTGAPTAWVQQNYYVAWIPQNAFPDDPSIGLATSAVDQAAGITFVWPGQNFWDTSLEPDAWAPFTGVTLNAANPSADILFQSKPNDTVQLRWVSTNIFSENSLAASP